VKPTKNGQNAVISCAISAPLTHNQILADVSQQVLKQLAKQELTTHQPGYRLLSERDRRLADHHAYEVVWENQIDSQTVTHQTLYFFVENRLYALSLQTPSSAFKWIVPDFQNWLSTVRVLSRQNKSALAEPSRGGLWIHQTGGIKIPLGQDWLIAVADDRQLGAAFAQDSQHTEFTATVDASSSTDREFAEADRKQALKSLRKKGLRVTNDRLDAFHGYPSYVVEYEGRLNDRVIKGMDIWVLTPKGRWLFNVEGDVSLYNSLTDAYKTLFDAIEFI
jgi:hypothetical protein